MRPMMHRPSSATKKPVNLENAANRAELGLTYALPKDFSIGAFYSKAYDADPRGYGNIAQGGVYPRPLGDSTVTVFIQKTF